MGLLSLVVAVFAAASIWFWFAYMSVGAPSVALPSMATSIQGATSCESLKRVCTSLAEAHDTDTAYIRSLGRVLDQQMWVLILGSLGWGALSGAAFLYIFSIVRRAEGADT